MDDYDPSLHAPGSIGVLRLVLVLPEEGGMSESPRCVTALKYP